MFQTYGYWASVEILQTSCYKIAHSEAAVKQGISQKQCPIPCFELWEQYFCEKAM